MNKPRGQPFASGNNAGRGRPPGSRNKTRSGGQDLLDEHAAGLTRNCIVYAMRGDPSAMRICMERAVPVRREASIRLSLARIRTAQDMEKAAEKTTRAVARGKITPAQGETMMNLLESHGRIIEKGQYESRLEKLEQSMAAAFRPVRAENSIELVNPNSLCPTEACGAEAVCSHCKGRRFRISDPAVSSP